MAKVSADITESFVSETGEFLEEIRGESLALKANPADETALSHLLRNLHTIKGNARMLGFPKIEHLSHALEDIYKSVKDGNTKNSDRLVRLVFFVADKIKECLSQVSRDGNDNLSIDLLLRYCDKLASGDFIDIDELSAEIRREKAEEISGADEDESDEPITDIKSVRVALSRVNDIISSFDTMITREFRLKHQLDELRKIEEATKNHELSKIRKQFEADIFALETSIFGVQEQVFDLRMLPISLVLRPFESTIALEAMQLGKKVRANIPDTQIAIDKVILEKLGDVIMHLVRNALDHGIEPPEERRAGGKDETGTISITCVRETKHVEITVSDDGRGLDYDKIREKALVLFPERGDEIADMGNRELSQFLFRAGFSTRDTVTETAGRGMGLDVVWTNIEKIKGRIKIESTPRSGTTFTLRFPLSLSTMQGMFVFANKEKFLIPSQHIVDIVYRKKSEYITLQNQRYIKLEGQLIPCFSLSSLFKEQKAIRRAEADSILVAEYMEQRIGIIVEEVAQYVSLVVKPLPASFKNFSILQGIVFDEHYAIVPILHVPDILKEFKALRGYDIKKYEAATKRRVVRILVVDDSDTTRQIEKSILESGDFQVDTASDGIDALECIKTKQYDLIITDRDMPRMNGLVFLDNIRRMENYAKVPVVVITAEGGSGAEEEFSRAGANAFIAKGDFKRGKLIDTVHRLLGEEPL
ncbi:MAG: response regulator [Treponema sp.]|nr:response regulator [Treponema sp.]